MKIKQIKNINQLPPEFSLDKYKPTFDFDIVDWVRNLELRVLSIYMETCCGGAYMKDMPRRSVCILDLPLLGKVPFDVFKKDPGLSKHIYTSSVHDFEVRDFYWQNIGDDRLIDYMSDFDAHINRDYCKEYTVEERSEQEAIEQRLSVPYFQMMEDCGINHNGEFIVKIDLHGTDEKIISDFTKWLSTTREKLKITTRRKKFTEDEFSLWCKNAILPYLDLTAWARANGFEITQQLLGTVLFPNEYDVNLAERIRKVIQPMAKNMAREVFTDSLRAQALSDFAEGKIENFVPDKDWHLLNPDWSID